MAQAMASEKKADTSGSQPKQAPAKTASTKPAASKTAGEAAAKPTPAPSPKQTAPAAGKWRIQLGAFGQRKSAEALYTKLSGKLSGRQAYYVPAGAVVRLQAGPYETRAAASAACSKLAPQPCFAVEAR